MSFKLKLTNSETLLKIGSMELDKQDILILFGLIICVLVLAVVIDLIGFSGTYAFVTGLFLEGIIFRNALIPKGHIKPKQ